MTGALLAVAAVVGGSGLTAALVLRLFISKGLDLLAKSHEERMAQAHQERMASIQAGHAKELAAFKSTLADAAHEYRTRVTALVARQGDAIAEIYGLLAKAETAVRELLATPSEDLDSAMMRHDALVEHLNSATQKFEQCRIFLTPEAAGAVDELMGHFSKSGLFSIILRAAASRPEFPEEKKAWPTRAMVEVFDKFAPPARAALEDQFRGLLGVVDRTSSNEAAADA